MIEITAKQIEALAIGAWILGTGGGGSPYHGLLNMRERYRMGDRVSLVGVDEISDDAKVAVVSTMGAPLVNQERLVDSQLVARSVEVMQDYLGITFDCVMGIEIGGLNGMHAMMAAAHLNIPVVDADAMGRAYPEAQMTTFAVGDLQPAPLASVDPRGNEVVIARVPTWKWMERTSRKICTEFGSTAATCKAPRSGLEIKQWGIRGTTTKAIRLGEAVLRANAAHENPIQAILQTEAGKLLFAGKVVEVERRTTEGFLRGRVRISNEGSEDLVLDFQNEWVVAWQGGKPVASTPELICVLDSDTGEAIGTEMIRYGQRVTAIVMPSPDIFLTARGLEHVGPAAFGYDINFKSVFAS